MINEAQIKLQHYSAIGLEKLWSENMIFFIHLKEITKHFILIIYSLFPIDDNILHKWFEI